MAVEPCLNSWFEIFGIQYIYIFIESSKQWWCYQDYEITKYKNQDISSTWAKIILKREAS